MTELTAIHQLLQELRLKGMEMVLEHELVSASKQGLSIQACLLALLQAEQKHQQERRLQYRINQAKLPFDWSLAGLEFIQRGDNIVFIGEPGTGKTGLALSLMRKALLEGYRGRFFKVQDLLDELYASLADRSTSKLFKRLCNYDILLLDELGYLTLNEKQMNMFFKLMDERYTKARPTMITSNLSPERWYGLLKPKTMVDALLDRLHHRCVTIRIQGDSLRRPAAE